MINWNNVFILIYQEAVPIMAIAMADVIMEEDITALMDTVDAATNCYTLKSTTNNQNDVWNYLLKMLCDTLDETSIKLLFRKEFALIWPYQ